MHLRFGFDVTSFSLKSEKSEDHHVGQGKLFFIDSVRCSAVTVTVTGMSLPADF